MPNDLLRRGPASEFPAGRLALLRKPDGLEEAHQSGVAFGRLLVDAGVGEHAGALCPQRMAQGGVCLALCKVCLLYTS